MEAFKVFREIGGQVNVRPYTTRGQGNITTDVIENANKAKLIY